VFSMVSIADCKDARRGKFDPQVTGVLTPIERDAQRFGLAMRCTTTP
jgi:hypothetical protein